MNKIKINKISAFRNVAMIALFGLITAPSAEAKQRLDAKCYVELYGGAKTVIFIEVNEKESTNLEQVAKQWVNKKVMTPLSRKKKVIYKVHECALLFNDFKSAKARTVDAEIGR